ncbi:MAG: methionine adenosyltransferase [Alphaproteobacteria bacterium]
MSKGDYLFTSESVSEGHPDKVCDRISDEVVDTFLAADADARVACETLVTTNFVMLAGETRGPASITPDLLIEKARAAIRDIGYEQDGFHWKTADIQCRLHAQSQDIAQGVDAAGNKDVGAGDQGIMFGYACRETAELMPAPIQFSHHILREMAAARHAGKEPMLGPDAKSQVTLEYRAGRPVGCTAILVSTQHQDGVDQDQVREIVRPYVMRAIPDGWMCDEDKFYVNPTGRFVIGGPDGDAGVTGRKIIVDTYGGAAPHGGGAFSGKDPTKVDRSAAYAARYLAKNVVAAGLAERCTIQLAYGIGMSQPISIFVDCDGTAEADEAAIARALGQTMDLSPRGIREHLGLTRPIYARSAAYGHFGRTPDADGGFSWERTDLAEALKRAVA